MNPTDDTSQPHGTEPIPPLDSASTRLDTSAHEADGATHHTPPSVPLPATHDELLQRAATQMPVLLRIVRRVAKRVMAEYAPRMAALGEGQARVLHVLYDEGALQAGDLAERCGVANPTVSKMLKSLEHQQLIERHTDPTNRRAVWVRLTQEGSRLFDQMQASFQRGMVQVLGDLSDEQLRDLLHTMGHLEHLEVGASGTHRRPRTDHASS